MDHISHDQYCRADDLGCFINVDRNRYPDEPRRVPAPEDLATLLNTEDAQPLAGVPYVVKDVVNTGIFPTTAGTAALEQNLPPKPAELIRRLNVAGATLFGTTNLHELSFGITSNNAYTGAVRNPWDHELSAGGSSGGTAVAVALGLVQFGVAADTGGSARLPASFCGVYGFRPTHGRYPAEGVVPISPTRDTLGLMADSIPTIATVDGVITGQTDWNPDEFTNLQGMRIGIAADVFGQQLDKTVTKAWESAKKRLIEAGAELVEVDIAAAQEVTMELAMPLCLAEFPQALQRYLDDAEADLTVAEIADQVESRDVAMVLKVAMEYEHNTAEDIAKLLDRRETGQRLYRQALENAGVDFMLYPSSPATAPELAEDGTTKHLGQRVDAFTLHTSHAHLAGVLGFPAASVQIASSGLPVGIDVAGNFDDDRRVLAFADKLSVELI